jgi:hypothetical protein
MLLLLVMTILLLLSLGYQAFIGGLLLFQPVEKGKDDGPDIW